MATNRFGAIEIRSSGGMCIALLRCCKPATSDHPTSCNSSVFLWQEKGRPADTARRLERLREPGFQEFAQLRCRLELWNGIEFFECRCERIRETPDRSRREFFVLWLEILCCRQHKPTYVTQRFMWRPPRDAHKDGSITADQRHIIVE